MTKPYEELEKLRKGLLARVTLGDLHWTTWPLRDNPKQAIADAPYEIDVCRAVAKDGYFLPITTDEMFDLAAKWVVEGLFPLTSAVMDQTVFGANYVPRKHMDHETEIRDFEKYSLYLQPTIYATAVSVGAHKLWVISGKGRRINHGFHAQQPPKGAKPPYLQPGWTAIQIVGTAHETEKDFWDYSQLLQFMKNFKTKQGQKLDLRTAIQNKHPALWDPLFEPGNPVRLP